MGKGRGRKREGENGKGVERRGREGRVAPMGESGSASVKIHDYWIRWMDWEGRRNRKYNGKARKGGRGVGSRENAFRLCLTNKDLRLVQIFVHFERDRAVGNGSMIRLCMTAESCQIWISSSRTISSGSGSRLESVSCVEARGDVGAKIRRAGGLDYTL